MNVVDGALHRIFEAVEWELDVLPCEDQVKPLIASELPIRHIHMIIRQIQNPAPVPHIL